MIPGDEKPPEFSVPEEAMEKPGFDEPEFPAPLPLPPKPAAPAEDVGPPPPPPEPLKTIEQLGIGAQDPYPSKEGA